MTIRTIWIKGEVPYTKNFGTLAELLALVPSTEFAEGFASDHGRIDWVKGSGWMSGGKLLSADGSISMSGPVRVEGPIVANTSQTVDALKYGVAVDGVTDSTAALQAACDAADAIGAAVILPACPIVFSSTILANRLRGVPGWTRLVPSSSFTFATDKGFVSNRHFRPIYNDPARPADWVEYTGLTIDWAPSYRNDNGYIRLANVRGGVIENNYFAASKVLDGGGKPYVVGAFIDLWGTCKNVTIRKNRMAMLTGAYGSNRIAWGGGGCIWIRCFQYSLVDAEIEAAATENNIISENEIVHWTSDEAIAIYGVKGIARYNTIEKNNIYSPPSDTSATDPYHITLISIFPSNDGSAQGGKAATYGNRVSKNTIVDYSCWQSVYRCGNSGDSANRCYANRTSENDVTMYLSSNPTNGQHAIWVALGSSGVDPAIGTYAYYIILGTPGTGYPGIDSHNDSLSDKAIGIGTPYAAFFGHHQIEAPKVDGFSIGTFAVRDLLGGQIHVGTVGLYNTNRANGTRIFVDVDATFARVFTINQGGGVFYHYENLRVSGSGVTLGYVGSGAGAVNVKVHNCCGSLKAPTGTAAFTQNSASARCVLEDNEFLGTISAIYDGTGVAPILRNNNWAGTTD